MSYPDKIEVRIVEIDGTSCGSNEAQLELVSGSNPLKYSRTSGSINVAEMVQDTANNTWILTTFWTTGGACGGFRTFRRDPDADDPTGKFCLVVSGVKDCSEGEAASVDAS